MKYMSVLLLLVAVIPSHGQKWDHESEGWDNSMPDWDSWAGESGSEDEYNSAQGDILDEFIDSNGMSFSDFNDYMNNYSGYDSTDPAFQSTAVHPSSGRHQDWIRRIYQWENEIPDIRGFSWMLKQLDLSRIQMMYLDALTLWVEFEINELRDYHEIESIRISFFEEFVEDFFMPVDIYFLWEDRNWYESDVHDLISDVMNEIHEMLSTEQLSEAREIVGYMLSH